MPRWALLAMLLVACASAEEDKDKKAKPKNFSRGWGDNITWEETYEAGLEKMVESNKPLMVIHHQEDCPYSQALKKAFVAARSIQKMAKQDFIMLNLVSETRDKNLAPDGYYVPRIVFVDPSLTVRADITGLFDNRLYTYEPNDMILLVKNMKKAKLLLHSEL